MPHQLYPKPTTHQRIKLALHYLTPQHPLTRLAGWVANQQWGAVTHFIIRQFARAYKINWQEAAQPNPSDYPTFNQFFTRALKDGARPIVAGDNQIALPADGRVSQSGEIQADQLLQAKGHSFTLEDLLAGDAYLTAQFRNGSFLTTYLSPRDYHRVHMPCAATLHQMIYVPGELYSVNPFLAQHIPNLFARNERVICVFDTAFGKMVQILVGATITASIRTTWAGIINPPRSETVRVWDYPADGEQAIRFNKGDEMGAFLLGSTVINLFPHNAITLDARLQENAETRVGELLGTVN